MEVVVLASVHGKEVLTVGSASSLSSLSLSWPSLVLAPLVGPSPSLTAEIRSTSTSYNTVHILQLGANLQIKKSKHGGEEIFGIEACFSDFKCKE